MNTDELFDEWAKDEYEGAVKMTPIDYARLRGIQPQRVYYYLRNKKLTWDWCDCGRKVIVTQEADELFKLGDFKAGDE